LTTGAGIDPAVIPAKLEGISFGPDLTTADPVTKKTTVKHTLFVGNDDDYGGHGR
jgi:hypothetical protein